MLSGQIEEDIFGHTGGLALSLLPLNLLRLSRAMVARQTNQCPFKWPPHSNPPTHHKYH